MSAQTPIYLIDYMTPGDRIKDLATVNKAQAERMEQALLDAEVPPGNPDLNSVLARLNALEALSTPKPWTQIPLVNGNTPLDGNYPSVRYSHDSEFLEFAGGFLFGATVNAGSTVGTLPTGFRPATYKNFLCRASIGVFTMVITPDGIIRGDQTITGPGGWLDLSQVRFAVTGPHT